MKVVALLLCCLLVAQANVLKSERRKEWEKFLSMYEKTYESDVEREFRFKIFVQNLDKIVRHNEEYEDGRKTFKMAINRYSDMLATELFSDLRVPITKKNFLSKTEAIVGELPDSIDWREKGAVTPVKDEYQCGASWAFSATGSLEAQHFLKNGQQVRLSEKNLIDCSTDHGNEGCNGGFISAAFQYIIDNKGIDTEEAYPYEPVVGECLYDPANIGTVEVGYVDLQIGNETALQEAVATAGPVSVAINANGDFQSYSSGVMVSEDCDPQKLNRAVLVVGYGTENDQDYWLVKNSWGVTWGEEGYIKMARNHNNMCGISNAASYPTV